MDPAEQHMIRSSTLSSGQWRVVCTCDTDEVPVRFSGPLPGSAYTQWLAHRKEALEAVES